MATTALTAAAANQQQYYSNYHQAAEQQQQQQNTTMSSAAQAYYSSPQDHQQQQHSAMVNYHASTNYHLTRQQQQQQQQQSQQHQSYHSVYGHQQQSGPLASLTAPLAAHHHQELVCPASMTATGTLTKLDTMTPNESSSSSSSSSSTTSSSAASLHYTLEQATKSTKGASKLRRDLINTEIAQLRELLPLPASTRQRLSQLQLMALVLVYVRKSNYFCNAFRNFGITREPSLAVPTSGFSKALNGFIMMLTQKGKLLYISDNATEYLGHSMEDLLSHGDEVYDIIEEQDKKIIRTELLSNDDEQQNSSKSSISSLSQQQTTLPTTETRIALCRMNVSRNARRQMRFGDQKVVLIEGHYSGYLPLSSRDEPVFLATCTPVAMPETRECVVQGSTHVFTSIHSMDMKFLYIDGVGEHHLNCTKQEIQGKSWYELIELDYIQEAQAKHKRITTNDQERSTIALLKLMNYDQTGHIWVHSVMQVKEAVDSTTQPVIVCTNQVLSEREAQVMRSNAWLYQFYSLHSKLHCNFSAGSPLNGDEIQDPDSPQSVCSDTDDLCQKDLKSTITNLTNPILNGSSKKLSLSDSLSLGGGQTKSPPIDIASPRKRSKQSANTGDLLLSPTIKLDSTQQQSTTASGYASSVYGQQPVHSTTSTMASHKSKLSPHSIRSPSSTTSTISSSPISSLTSSFGQQQPPTRSGSKTGTIYPAHITPTRLVSSTTTAASIADFNQSAQHPAHYQNYANSIGSSSSSASSTSSVSSLSSTANTASDLVVAAAAAAARGTTASLYGTSFDSSTIDPLQHMHSSVHHHHHHPAMYSAGQQHSANHHHHAAAAVNYANHVMAAQRSHHHYHPYSHPQHQTSASHHHNHHHQQHNHSTSDQLQHHQQQASHPVAPYHHHNHHTNSHAAVAAAALYAPNPHHVAAAAAAGLNGAFGHHHHHAAYHSAAAVAAVSQHHHAATNSASDIHSSYHTTGAAAVVAASAAAHPGVSFHYNKIAATVNASA